jgi:hypothetical protein
MKRCNRLRLEALEGREVPADLAYAFHIPGLAADAQTHVVADSLGNTYVTGTYSGTIDLDPNPANALSLTARGGTDIFVAKYGATGQLLWAKSTNGAANESAADIAIDGIGNVFVAGTFAGAVDFNPSPTGTATPSAASGGSAFLWKLDNFGNFFLARSVGGASSASGLAVNPLGSILVTGQFSGTADFNPSPAAVANLNTSNTNGAAFLWRLDSLGAQMWARAFQTSGAIESTSVALDALGNAFVSGRFNGTADLNPSDTVQASSAAGANWTPFVAKLNGTGNYLWARTLRTMTAVAGAQNTIGGMVLDGIGNVYAAGAFAGTLDFDPGTANVPLASAGSNTDGFAWKLDANGAYLYAKRFGGANAETVADLRVDKAGNAYIAGTFTGIADFDPNPATTAVANLVSGSGVVDSYVLKLNVNGNLAYTRPIGGGWSTTQISGLWADGAGNMFIAGGLSGTGDFEPDTGRYPLSGGAGTGFVAKLSPMIGVSAKPTNSNPINQSAGGPYTIFEGDSLTVKASAKDLDGDALRYSWDLNGDGVFGDTNGATVTLTPARMAALGLGDSKADPVNIKVRVWDGVNLKVEATSTLTILNLAPISTLKAPTTTLEGVRPIIKVRPPIDPSNKDVKAGFKYSYDFNDDGAWDVGDGATYAGSVVASSLKPPASMVANAGPLAVRVRIFDKDGGHSDATTTIEVTSAVTTTALTQDAPAVAGLPVTFRFIHPVGAPSNPAAGLTYGFDFDNNNVYETIGPSASATWTFANAGTYTIRSSVTDIVGATTVYTLTLTVAAL